MKRILLFLFSFAFVFSAFLPMHKEAFAWDGTEPLIIDHNSINIASVPLVHIEAAKSTFHIGYGHTSHGSQITTGMSGLVAFANNGGKGLNHPDDTFAWSHDGSTGLHLFEGSGYNPGYLDHDAGYSGWDEKTRTFLDENPEYNVIVWSWCGQVNDYYTNGTLQSHYLDAMTQLESEYPNVTFIYMTGHAEGTGEEGSVHLANQMIRQYCINNNKILFDFYDIELYDPDGNYFGDLFVDDHCDYNGGNWATEWQDAHTQGVDWYNCSSAHSIALNANMKAYAFWYMLARLAGWDGTAGDYDNTAPGVPEDLIGAAASQTQIDLDWAASTDPEGSVPASGVAGYRIYCDGTQIATSATNSYSDTGLAAGTTYSYTVSAYDAAGNVSSQSDEVEVTTLGPTSNHSPVLATIGAKSIAEGSLLEFTLSATDEDGDPLSYSADNLQSGAQLSPNGEFSWMPGDGQSGSYDIIFTVSDGQGGEDSESVNVTVTDVDDEPVYGHGSSSCFIDSVVSW